MTLSKYDKEAVRGALKGRLAPAIGASNYVELYHIFKDRCTANAIDPMDYIVGSIIECLESDEKINEYLSVVVNLNRVKTDPASNMSLEEAFRYIEQMHQLKTREQSGLVQAVENMVTREFEKEATSPLDRLTETASKSEPERRVEVIDMDNVSDEELERELASRTERTVESAEDTEEEDLDEIIDSQIESAGIEEPEKDEEKDESSEQEIISSTEAE